MVLVPASLSATMERDALDYQWRQRQKHVWQHYRLRGQPTGAVTVDGAGSTWTTGGDLDVGR